MFTLYFLRIPFPNFVSLFGKMTGIGPPIIGVVLRDAEGFQKRFQTNESPIFTRIQHVSQHLSRVVINRVPEPSLLRFVADIAPHFIGLRFNPFQLNLPRGGVLQAIQQGMVDFVEGGFFFLMSQSPCPG